MDMRRANALLLNMMLLIIIFRESSNFLYTCGLLQSNFILVEQMIAQRGLTILDSFTILECLIKYRNPWLTIPVDFVDWAGKFFTALCLKQFFALLTFFYFKKLYGMKALHL